MKLTRAVIIALAANLVLIGFAVCLGLFKTGNPSRYFGEGRFTTAFSCAQLLAVAWFSLKIFVVRRPVASTLGFLSCAWVWAAMGAGFIFLAADDAFQIHEQLDGIIHKLLHAKQTAVTDRLDDAIVGIYGVIGLAVLWLFRGELLVFKQMWRVFGGGFLCLFASVACDAISNGDQFLIWVTGNVAMGKKLDGWFSVGDGGFTLLAEGLFVAAFYLSSLAATKWSIDATPRAATNTTIAHPPTVSPLNPS